jgi:hypothetical protein
MHGAVNRLHVTMAQRQSTGVTPSGELYNGVRRPCYVCLVFLCIILMYLDCPVDGIHGCCVPDGAAHGGGCWDHRSQSFAVNSYHKADEFITY